MSEQGVINPPSVLTIHSENVYASGIKKRPRGPRPAKSQHLAHKSSPERSILSVKDEAHQLYMVYHLASIDNASLVAKQPDSLVAYAARSADPLVAYALSSVSLAIFSRLTKSFAATVEASTQYASLLKLLRPALLSLDQVDLEACLLAVLLMSFYEDAMYQQLPSSVPLLQELQNARHYDGILALLRQWTITNPSTTGSTVIKHARRAYLKSTLTQGKLLPEWLRDGERYGETGLDLEFDKLWIRMITARQSVTVHQSAQDGGQLETVYDDLRKIDIGLQVWTAMFPSSWRSHSINPEHSQVTPNQNFFSGTIYVHENLSAAAAWVRFYATRMLLCSIRIDALHLRSVTTDPALIKAQVDEQLATIHAAAVSLACTLPYVLGRITVSRDGDEYHISNNKEGYAVVFDSGLIMPMLIASGLRYVDISLRHWFKSQVVQMGQTMGYGLLEMATRHDWIQF